MNGYAPEYADPRDEMNQRQGFEEDTEGFARNFVLANANICRIFDSVSEK